MIPVGGVMWWVALAVADCSYCVWLDAGVFLVIYYGLLYVGGHK